MIRCYSSRPPGRTHGRIVTTTSRWRIRLSIMSGTVNYQVWRFSLCMCFIRTSCPIPVGGVQVDFTVITTWRHFITALTILYRSGVDSFLACSILMYCAAFWAHMRCYELTRGMWRTRPGIQPSLYLFCCSIIKCFSYRLPIPATLRS